jgi:hypothetical protein
MYLPTELHSPQLDTAQSKLILVNFPVGLPDLSMGTLPSVNRDPGM